MQNCEEKAKKALSKPSVIAEENASGDKVLYYFKTESTPQLPQTMLYYVVLRKEDCSELKRGEIFNGKIYWADENTLEYYSVPGMMRKGEDIDDLKQRIELGK